MKRILYIVVMCFVLTSCSKDQHDNEQGLAVAFEISDSDPLDAVTIWVFSSDNILKEEYRYSSAREQAANYLPLPAGEYSVVAVTNMTDAFECNAVKGSTTLDGLFVELKAPSASPPHIHYTKATATVKATGITVVAMPLSRVLAELQFTIKNIPPEVVRVEAQIANTTKGFFPGVGKLSTETQTTDLGMVTPVGGVISFPKMQLMPVVEYVTRADELQTHVRFTFHYDNGGSITFTAQTPAMQNGGVYTPEIEYALFRPGVTLQINAINGWVELPAINGEILYPN